MNQITIKIIKINELNIIPGILQIVRYTVLI